MHWSNNFLKIIMSNQILVLYDFWLYASYALIVHNLFSNRCYPFLYFFLILIVMLIKYKIAIIQKKPNQSYS